MSIWDEQGRVPACFGASGSVRASNMQCVAWRPIDVHTFLPVDDESVAVTGARDLGRAQPGEIAAVVGLAEALAPELVAR